MDTKFGDSIVHWSIAILNFLTNFGLIAVFVKVALEITKSAHHCVLPGFTCFHVFRNHASLLAFSGLKNEWMSEWVEWVVRTFGKDPGVTKFVCIESSVQFMHNFYPFAKIPRYLEILLLTDFCETLHSRRQAPEVLDCKAVGVFLKIGLA